MIIVKDREFNNWDEASEYAQSMLSKWVKSFESTNRKDYKNKALDWRETLDEIYYLKTIELECQECS